MQGHFSFGPAPWGPGEGPKSQILLNTIKFQLQSQFQRFFKPNFVCLLKNERYKTYKTGFLLGCLGDAPEVGLGGAEGGGGQFFFQQFNQSWCVSNSYEWHMYRHIFFRSQPPWGLGEGPKGQISLNLNY